MISHLVDEISFLHRPLTRLLPVTSSPYVAARVRAGLEFPYGGAGAFDSEQDRDQLYSDRSPVTVMSQSRLLGENTQEPGLRRQ